MTGSWISTWVTPDRLVVSRRRGEASVLDPIALMAIGNFWPYRRDFRVFSLRK